MPVFKKPEPLRFTPDNPVEMHFHDSDETWIMMGGKAIAHMVEMIEPMVSHVVSVAEALKIYDMLAHHSEDLLGVVFGWRNEGERGGMVLDEYGV